MSKNKTNLLDETLHMLQLKKINESDVLWVGNTFIKFYWEHFKELAKNLNYDSGYGGAEIAGDLMIVGAEWWMTRGEYDGSEWWDFHTKPNEPIAEIKVNHLSRMTSTSEDYGDDLLSINDITEEDIIAATRVSKINIVNE